MHNMTRMLLIILQEPNLTNEQGQVNQEFCRLWRYLKKSKLSRPKEDIAFICNNGQVQQFGLLSFYTLPNNTKLNNIMYREAWMHQSLQHVLEIG